MVDEVQGLELSMVQMLVPLLRDHPLIVVGYRGGEPSVMRHLLLENAESAHHYWHGIFGCKMRDERIEDMSLGVLDLAGTIGSNFTVVDIDGFDELFGRDLWTLHLDAQSAAGPSSVVSAGTEPSASTSLPSPTLHMSRVSFSGLGDIDWATLRARIVQYCNALQIRVPSQVDRI